MAIILSIVIFIFSVILHEVSHGFMADRLGDPTPRLQGRLTLNPLKHIDPIGSVILPLLLIVSTAGNFVIGWAKPVPYNPYNLKNKRQGEFLIAAAGPLSNILIALIFGLIIRFLAPGAGLSPSIEVFSYIVLINLVLAIFNLIPVPPLDGSKLLFAFLPHQYGRLRFALERYGMILTFVVVFVLWQFIFPIVPLLFRLITGMPA